MDAHDFEIWSTAGRIVVTEPAALGDAVALTGELLSAVEAACSRFRDDSESMRLPEGWSEVSPLLAELVQASLEAAWASGGAVDPTLGATMAALGYDRSFEQLRSDGRPRLRVVPTLPGYRSLRLEGRRLYRPRGVQLDLGATAKAYAADRAARSVAERLGCGVLVSLGGDIATAGHGPEGGWQVTVQDLPSDDPQQVTLADGAAVATSSTVRRTWRREGRAMHHVVDPRTGLPTTGPWRTVTVVGPDCVAANTASTAALVKGFHATAWLRSRSLPARLVDGAGRVRVLNGFPAEAAA